MGTVSSCCCGCTLGQGTVGIGIYCMINAVINLSVGIWVLRYLNDMKYYDYVHNKSAYTAFGAYAIFAAAVVIIVTIFLFVGVSQKRRGFLIPWLFTYGIIIVLGAPVFIYLMTNVNVNFSLIVSQGITLSIMIYLYIVVYSYYKSFEPQAIYATPYNQPGYVLFNAGGVANPDYNSTKYPYNVPPQPMVGVPNSPNATTYPVLDPSDQPPPYKHVV